MEEGQVGEEAELRREVPGDVAVVEVDARDGRGGGVIRRRRAVHAGVAADAGAGPVGGEVHGVGEDGGLPCPEGNVGVAESGVVEFQRRVDRGRRSDAAAALREELAAADVPRLAVGQAWAGEARRGRGI